MWRGGDGAGPCVLADEGLQEEGFPCTPAKGWAQDLAIPARRRTCPGTGDCCSCSYRRYG